MTRPMLFLAVVLTFAIAAPSATGQVYYRTIRDVGSLDGYFSEAKTINNLGHIAGEASFGDREYGFLYKNGSITDQWLLQGGHWTRVYGMNDDDEIVGESVTALGVTDAFLYQGGALTRLPTLGGALSSARAINNQRKIVGYSEDALGYYRAVLYQGGVPTPLPTLGGNFSAAYGINEYGEIVGESDAASGTHAFLYSSLLPQDRRMLDLAPWSRTSSAMGINNNGQIVGKARTGTGDYSAFLYQRGRMMELGPLTLNSSYSRLAINDMGRIVGSSDQYPFLYQGGRMMDLNVLVPEGSGWKLSYANDINDVGQIVGFGNIVAQLPWLRRGFLLTDPVLKSIVPMSQGGSSMRADWTPMPPRVDWGTEPYAPNAYNAFVARLQKANPQDPEIARLRDAQGRYNLTQKGCLLASYAMALGALGVDAVNPLELQVKLQKNDENAFWIEGWPDTGPHWLASPNGVDPPNDYWIPRLNGANVTPTAISALYGATGLQIRTPRSDWDVLTALGAGDPVILQVRGTDGQHTHSVLAYGWHEREDETKAIDLIDPARRTGTGSAILPNDRSRERGNGLSLGELDGRYDLVLGLSHILSLSGLSSHYTLADCAVAVTMTDPTGARVAFDTRQGLISSTIGGALVARITPEIGEDWSFAPEEWDRILAGDLPTMVSIPGDAVPTAGQYTFQVTGLEDGEFRLSSWWPGWGTSNEPFMVEGYLRAGETVTFDYFVVPEPSTLAMLIGAMVMALVWLTRRPNSGG